MRNKDLEKLETVIRQTCVEDDARVLLSTFANDRTQNMLTHIYDIFGQDNSFDTPVLVDSPMAMRICNAYSELLQGEELNKWREVLAWNILFKTQTRVASGEIAISQLLCLQVLE